MMLGLLWLPISHVSAAQLPPGFPPAALELRDLIRIVWGTNAAFSADVTVTSPAFRNREEETTEAHLEVRNEGSLVEIRRSSSGIGALQSTFAGRGPELSVLTLYASNLSYVISQSARSYAESALAVPPAERIKAAPMESSIEIIDTHPCRRQRIVVSHPVLKPDEYRVWRATDLGDFPVQIECLSNLPPARFRFTNVQLKEPAAATLIPLTRDKQRHDSLATLTEELVRQALETDPTAARQLQKEQKGPRFRATLSPSAERDLMLPREIRGQRRGFQSITP